MTDPSQPITITIDGKEIQAQKGELLTEAAARAGIEIPVFCSHPKLDPLGACRMCLVEAEGPRGRALITACTTPVAPGGVYHYNSPKAIDARQGTLELILINHPLDCPICDKGGECPLQNQTLEHGPGKSHFWEVKTHKGKNYPLSDLVLLDQERCIVCWRCIRYLQEWEDKPQLGLFHRGGETVIDKFPGAELDAYTSGSIIDLCPVGALTNRVARFGYRPWELERTDSICTHCAQGCNLRIDVRDNQVRRHVGRENMAVNDEWICDKGRFAAGVSRHPDRLTQPLMRVDGKLQPASWQEAVQRIASELKRIAHKHGPAAVGAIGSAKVSNEANYLLGKFMRALVGTNNLDFREGAALHAIPSGLPSLAAAKEADLIVLMGCDPSEEAPVLATFLKRAAKRGEAKVVVVHPRAIELTRYPGVFLQPAPGEETALFDALTRATLIAGDETVPDWLAAADPPDFDPAAITEAARLLAEAKRPFIVYGTDFAWGYGSRAIVTALTNWATAAGQGQRLGFLHSQANAQGAGDVGMLPDRLPGRRPLSDPEARARLEALWRTKLPAAPGLSYGGMMAGARDRTLKALYIMGADPAGEKPADAAALKTLDFLVVQDLFLTETAKLADVVLPAASYVESSGAFTNSERRVQIALQAVRPVGKSVADWNILMHIARLYAAGQTAAWDTTSVEAVFAEIVRAVPQYAGMSWENLGNQGQQAPWTLAETGLQPHEAVDPHPTNADFPFALVTGNQLWDDGTVFAATPQMAGLGHKAAHLHPTDAAGLGLSEGDRVSVRSPAGGIELAIHLDSSLKPGAIFVPFSLASAPVGSLFDRFGPRTNVLVEKI
jgi:NADH-quinone oxidoreductase chain G